MENEFNEIDPKRGDLVIISTFLHPPRLGGGGAEGARMAPAPGEGWSEPIRVVKRLDEW